MNLLLFLIEPSPHRGGISLARRSLSLVRVPIYASKAFSLYSGISSISHGNLASCFCLLSLRQLILTAIIGHLLYYPRVQTATYPLRYSTKIDSIMIFIPFIMNQKSPFNHAISFLPQKGTFRTEVCVRFNKAPYIWRDSYNPCLADKMCFLKIQNLTST